MYGRIRPRKQTQKKAYKVSNQHVAFLKEQIEKKPDIFMYDLQNLWIHFENESNQPFPSNTQILFKGNWDKLTHCITIGDRSGNCQEFRGGATTGSSVVEPTHPL